MKYPKLFSPCRLSKIELANRVVSSPCGTHTASGGFVSDRMVDLYSEIAGGGVGLVIVEDTMVHPLGMRDPYDFAFYDNVYMPGMYRLAKAIKDQGAKAAVHLSHGGRVAGKVDEGQSTTSGLHIPVAPSAIADPSHVHIVPRALTIEEIGEIEDSFAEAAWRAKEVGFDVIALHGAHVYLINQFLSPFSNKRQDDYGGDFNRRLRFLLEIIYKIKQRVGDDFPLMCSLNGVEVVEGGLTIEDARQITMRLEAAGIHGVRISVSPIPVNFTQYEYFPLSPWPPMRSPRGELVHLATAVKDLVSIPVMVAGRIITAQLAEQILEQGRADLIGIGRGLMADPEWPKKAQEGRERETRYCISCSFCGNSRFRTQLGACAINPRYAREGEIKITLAPKAKTVLIAGGGPAGLEAARIAALRGHKVTLYEKGELGGQLNLACIPPGKDEIKLFLDFEQVQLEILGVKIKNEELTLETVKREKPEAVVVATGALPVHPDFPGSHNKNVVTAWQVLRNECTPIGRVVVLGGKQIGAETAEYLASKGSKVTIVEGSTEIARDATSSSVRGFLLLSLRFLGVNILANTTVVEITKNGVTVNTKGQLSSIDADTVVLALGNKPNRELVGQLEKLDIELHIVGDCTGVGKMVKAIRGGFHAGLAL